MITIKGPTLYCDVDDTLVSWDFGSDPAEDKMEFIDPTNGQPLYLKVITPTVEALKQHFIRGHNIVVWSAGGGEWAEVVVRRLGLQAIVTACADKPHWFLDDITASEFMPESIRRDLRSKE